MIFSPFCFEIINLDKSNNSMNELASMYGKFLNCGRNIAVL